MSIGKALAALGLYLVLITASAASDERLVVFGASGKIGSVIVDKALDRGYLVVGVSRNPEKIMIEHAYFEAVKGDVFDVDFVQGVSAGAKGVILSISNGSEPGDPAESPIVRAASAAISALSGVDDASYLLQVGGNSSFGNVDEATVRATLIEQQASARFVTAVVAHVPARDAYKSSDIDWTLVSPESEILGWSPQGVTDAETSQGAHRASASDKPIAADGTNKIYVRDLAIAILDEIANRAFVRVHFTVGY